MTQAIAMSQMLQRRGHRVAAVLVGSNQTRSLPAFFEQGFSVPVRRIASPGFSLNKGRAVSMAGSAACLVRQLPGFRRSLGAIGETIKAVQPDLIVNFLEPLMGVYNLLRPHATPVLVVGHQFMIEHPQFVKVREFAAQQFGMRQFVRLTGARSARLALSFYPAPDIPERNLFVSPPILRRQVFELRSDSVGGYLLVYLLNHGYAPEIIRWHGEHPEVPIHCFYDKPGAPEEERHDATLVFHRIHGDKFLRMMASSRGVACTAGFESVCEAVYLGKPLLMVPVENHLEQYLNGCDAEQAGIAVRDTAFHLSRLLDPVNAAAVSRFRLWVDEAEARAMRAVEQTAFQGRSRGSAPADEAARPDGIGKPEGAGHSTP
jgi:uncharacterized protein (TIGR00661 family)